MIITYFETPLEDFLSLSPSDSAVDCNLFITTNTEGSHSVAGLREHGLLTSELFQHLQEVNYMLNPAITNSLPLQIVIFSTYVCKATHQKYKTVIFL